VTKNNYNLVSKEIFQFKEIVVEAEEKRKEL
jgi:hypothetical protein